MYHEDEPRTIRLGNFNLISNTAKPVFKVECTGSDDSAFNVEQGKIDYAIYLGDFFFNGEYYVLTEEEANQSGAFAFTSKIYENSYGMKYYYDKY
jgi:hypothetical protein